MYAYDIYRCYILIPVWQDKLLMPSKSALDEMYDNDISYEDVIEILEEGFDCSRSKRKKNKLERCSQRGNKIIKVVVVATNEHLIITHVGKFTASKKKLQQLKRR